MTTSIYFLLCSWMIPTPGGDAFCKHMISYSAQHNNHITVRWHLQRIWLRRGYCIKAESGVSLQSNYHSPPAISANVQLTLNPHLLQLHTSQPLTSWPCSTEALRNRRSITLIIPSNGWDGCCFVVPPEHTNLKRLLHYQPLIPATRRARRES